MDLYVFVFISIFNVNKVKTCYRAITRGDCKNSPYFHMLGARPQNICDSGIIVCRKNIYNVPLFAKLSW